MQQSDTVAHDVSARDWQLKKNGGQWLLGKTFDNYAPIGQAIVTKGSIDPNNVAVKCRVNGETLQDGHTREFVFTPQFCLAWLRYATLCATSSIAARHGLLAVWLRYSDCLQ